MSTTKPASPLEGSSPIYVTPAEALRLCVASAVQRVQRGEAVSIADVQAICALAKAQLLLAEKLIILVKELWLEGLSRIAMADRPPPSMLAPFVTFLLDVFYLEPRAD